MHYLLHVDSAHGKLKVGLSKWTNLVWVHFRCGLDGFAKVALLKWVSCEYSTRKQLWCTSTSTVWSCAPALRVHLQYHTSTHTCKHIHTHIHTHTHTHTHMHTPIYPHAHSSTHTHTCTYSHTHTHIPTHITHIYTHLHPTCTLSSITYW